MSLNCEMSDTKMYEIDGSFEEGGGQLLRFTVSISAIIGVAVKIFNIRKGRPKPGLSAQHLKGLELVRDICNGQLEGAVIGSTEITFKPGKLKSGHFKADTQTAGSISLLLQVSFPCLLFANGESSVDLRGGTDVPFSPPLDYLTLVFNPIAKTFGVNCDLQIKQRGYYPRGGGVVNAHIKPLSTIPIPSFSVTERGELTKIFGWSYVAGTVNMRVAHILAEEAERRLKAKYGDVSINIERKKESPRNAVGNCSGILLIGETSTGCRYAGTSLFRKDSTPELLGVEAAEMLISNLNHGGCVDDYLQDQLILFMALAKGVSKLKCGPITSHTRTVISLAEILTNAKFTVSPANQEDSQSYIIECIGHGFTNTK